MWGSNSGTAGHLVQVISEEDNTASIFASGILVPPRNKPVMAETGPDGNIYYLLTDYETGDGHVHMIRYTGQAVTSAPEFNPLPGQYDDSIMVAISTITPDASIYYTTDSSNPDSTSTLYVDSIFINEFTTLKAIAYADSSLQSAVSVGEYIIGPVPNLPPIADAGPELIVKVGEVATRNGAGSYDPDGSSLEIMESWHQIDGPFAVLLDAEETVANFTPMFTGTYTFLIKIEDVEGALDSAETKITVIEQIPDVLEGLIARWSCETGFDNLIEDTSPNSNRGILEGGTWENEAGDNSDYSLFFDGINDLVDLGKIDISGDEMTVCFWTKIQSFSTHDARFISKANGQNDIDHKWMVSTLNGSKLRFRLNTDVGGTTTLISDENVLVLDKWAHIAAVYNGSEMKIYKDASLLTTTSKSGSSGTDPTFDAALGNQPSSASGGPRPFNGMMDDIRIYGRALSTEEIDSVMMAVVEKCTNKVSILNDYGNGSLRRVIHCAQSDDRLTFENMIDSIHITSTTININNNLTLNGNNSYLPIIFNNLMQPCIAINSEVSVSFDSLDLRSAYGPILFNAGQLNVHTVKMSAPENPLIPPVQNTGLAIIHGQFLINNN